MAAVEGSAVVLTIIVEAAAVNGVDNRCWQSEQMISADERC
ncbi:hypothetical protein [Duganella sp. Leaf126]|nr:hypothetical protein [Duganella sp. Leaf126]